MYNLVHPNQFSFSAGGQIDFNKVLSFFNWEIRDQSIQLDISKCTSANYQALSLLLPYLFYLKSNGKYVDVVRDRTPMNGGASKMWYKLNADAWHKVLMCDEMFHASYDKPLFALNQTIFSDAVGKIGEYTKPFGVNYENTLRYILAELFYNAIEHGKAYSSSLSVKIPPIVQYTWYRERNELHFMVADIGIGIKKHLEQTYPAFDSSKEAIIAAIKPSTSGTFGLRDIYSSNNNAGMGLYISSNIIRRLNAEMYIVSGSGLVHISPTDITAKNLIYNWPGTFVYFRIMLERNREFSYDSVLAELRASADTELEIQEINEQKNEHYLNIYNYFGKNAEDKHDAILHRDKYLIPAIQAGKILKVDFKDVVHAPHSFLNALLATPICLLGIHAYKKIKIYNAEPAIRDTIDYIFDENTPQ